MTLSTVLRMGSGFALFVLIARVLGAEHFGQLSYWMAVAGVATLPVNYGFGLYALREIGGNAQAAPQLIADTLLAKLVIAALVAAGFVAALQWLPAGHELAAWLLLGMFFLDSFAEHFNSGLRALGLFQTEAKMAVLISALNLALVGAATLWWKELTFVSAGLMVSRLLGLGLTWQVFRRGRRFESPDWGGAFRRLVQTLKAGFPYAADTVVSTMNSTVDVLILKSFAGATAVGHYQAGMRLMQGANAIAPILGNVYIPRLSNEYRQGGEVKALTAQLMLKLLGSAAVIALLFAWAGGPLITILFGAAYAPVASLMPWLGLLLLIRHLATSFGVNLTAAGQQKSRVLVNVCSLCMLCISAFLLTPIHGALGLVWALILAASLVAAAYAAMVRLHHLSAGLNRLNLLVLGATLVLMLPRLSLGV